MSTWMTHYKKAEEYLRRADDQSLGINAKAMLIARAQAHATLAQVKSNE